MYCRVFQKAFFKQIFLLLMSVRSNTSISTLSIICFGLSWTLFDAAASFLYQYYYASPHLSFFFLQYNWLQLDKTKNKWKINYEETTKKETRKYSTSTLLSQIEQWKKSREGVDARGKKNEYIFKPKERNNIKTMVLKMFIVFNVQPAVT